MSEAPCPTCGAPYGFHDDGPHAEAQARIPAHLMLPTATQERESRRTTRREAFAEYLRNGPTGPTHEAAQTEETT
jgi:hypothetical protein